MNEAITPCNKIKREILIRLAKNDPDWANGELDTNGQITDAYTLLMDSEGHWDCESDFRGGDYETKLPCPSSRHYESKSVAAKLSDGSWVGWTYWYGGGKHGEPGAIEWMEEAYDLTCVEEEKLVVVRTFAKAVQP